jgi:hypothetical protein
MEHACTHAHTHTHTTTSHTLSLPHAHTPSPPPQNSARSEPASKSIEKQQRSNEVRHDSEDRATESASVDAVAPYMPPKEELHLVMGTLTSEINDKHLVIMDILGQGAFGTVRAGRGVGG